MDGENNGTNAGQNNNPNAQNTTGQNNNVNQTSNNAIDYSKIQEMIDGRNAKTEESMLKTYFQKQGLNEAEMQTAIDNFKAEKAKKAQEQNQANIDLQNENATLKAQMQKMQLETKARDVAAELGIDPKTVPYVIKLADLKSSIDNEGKISDEALKTALNDVLEALPQLKSQVQDNNKGFQKIGGDNNESKNNDNLDTILSEIFS